jgi:iron complex transport system substrate-binding protein
MRLLGLKWVAQTLYPQRFDLDLEKEIRKFFRLFLQVDPSPEDIRLMLKGGDNR